MRFNNERYREIYEKVQRDAMEAGYTLEDLERPYIDRLSKQTKSKRILRMVRLAYWLGWLRGIKFCDEMFTQVTLS
ncbi:hypothetical protein MTAT_19570 [Moorella thermoacetica]|uniref:Uncharacterized protein n=1 Tax=Neomoorella thermoacetica TaxID=1525 RepID=A0AAC9MVD5_NEOTH|nr:hypothetical protein [Moorella thermoacetica]AOQ24614.1 hypothetical protein Maut_02184 [Moorella thermoacetica]TYL12715.1 hypothetical protein MTAT_19570 [Moorella thermoacetica]